MLNRRWRPVFFSAVAVVLIWVVALAGYTIARNSRVSADKVRAYAESVNLSQLSGDARAHAIRHLEDLLNSLSIEERRKARLQRLTWNWLEQMTDAEKGEFIDATMPTGFKQMLASFEQLPAEQRHRAVDDSLRRLREAQTKLQANGDTPATNGPLLSPELQAKVRTIGLKAFYSESSAQTKAELAPVLEELQRVMESGRPFHER